MPLRRSALPLILEELSTSDSGRDSALASDDELDDPARAAKRRRIEELGESYLQGKPLFISSALLRGPFDDGWVNPWKKQRNHLQASASHAKKINSRIKSDPVEGRVIPETDEKKRRIEEPPVSLVKTNRPGYMARKASSAFSEPAADHHRSLEVLNSREASVISRVSSRKKQRSLPWAENVTASSTKRESNTLDRTFRNDWLRKDRKVINIRDVDPPKSPTPLGRRGSVEEIQKRSSQTVAARVSARKVPSWPAGSDGTERLRSFPRDSPSAFHASGLSLREDTRGKGDRPITDGVHRLPITKDQPTGGADATGPPRSSSIASASKDVHVTDSAENRSRRSSVYIVPPSSHLPEFEYRRPKNPVRSEERFNRQQLMPNADGDEGASADPRAAIGVEEANGGSRSAHGPSDLQHNFTHPSNHDGTPDPSRPRGSIGTDAGPIGSRNTLSNSTQSEQIPSAQVVPENAGLVDCLISLHSTEMHAERDKESGLEDDNAQLSTQAALLLAQQSFQDDLATPESGIQLKPEGPDPDPLSCANKITPFAHINTTPERHHDSSPMITTTGGFQPLNTQAMIDAVTPFTFSSSRKSEAWMEVGCGLNTGSNSKPRKKACFALLSSPSGSVSHNFDSGTPQQDLTDHGMSGRGEDSSQVAIPSFDRVESQLSVQGSSHAVPLMLSGSTPTTEQQDGQGFIDAMDSFNVNQVIQDAGSWLQQSWDVQSDLRRCSGKGTRSSSSQTQRATVSFDTII
jgi:hypothetical protein